MKNNQPNAFLQSITDPMTKQAVQHLWGKVQALQKQTSGPIQGTLSPDTRPRTLGLADTGTSFHATDYDRLFVWTGSAWLDAPGQPTRGGISFFIGSPGPGWVQCNGQGAHISKSDGSLGIITTPTLANLSGQIPYMRV